MDELEKYSCSLIEPLSNEYPPISIVLYNNLKTFAMSIPVPFPVRMEKPIREENTAEKHEWDKYNKSTYLPLKVTRTFEIHVTRVFVPFPKHVSVASLQLPRVQSRIHATNLTRSNSKHLASMVVPANEFGDEIERPTTAMQLTNPGLYGRSSFDTARILGQKAEGSAGPARKSISAFRTFVRTESSELNKENEQVNIIKKEAEMLKKDLEVAKKDVEDKKRVGPKPEEVQEMMVIKKEADLLKKQVESTKKEVEAKRKKVAGDSKDRPETTDIIARRLIGRALGINLAKKSDEKTLRVEVGMRQGNATARSRK